MDDQIPCPPPPPIVYNDEFIWSTPAVYGPVLLLLTTLFIGIPRYIYVATIYSLHSESLLHQLSYFSRVITYLCILVTTTFVLDTVVIIARAIFGDVWTSSELTFYVAISWLSWVISLALLLHESLLFGKWYWTQYIFWEAALLTETLIASLWINGIIRSKEDTQFTIYDHLSFGIFVIRYIIEILVVLLSCVHLFSVSNIVTKTAETSPLLGTSKTSKKIRYSAVAPVVDMSSTKIVESRIYKKTSLRIGKILPFMWPQNDFKLQFQFIACFVFMTLGFIVSLLAPLQIGIVVDQLINGGLFWSSILLFVGLQFLQGGSGLLQIIQNLLWIPIGQHISREISLKTFSHLHCLSFDFHTCQRKREVVQIMDQGSSSVLSLLNQVIFQLTTVWVNVLLISIFTACIYAPLFGLIIFLTMSMYIYVTITVTERNTKLFENIKDLDKQTKTKMTDSLLNFETVKCNHAEDFEIARYRQALMEYQKADGKISVAINILSLSQNLILTGGLLCGCLLFAYAVVNNKSSVGDFVAFIFYLLQLYIPLRWFGKHYRAIRVNYIDVDKMFALLDEVQTVKDVPNATDINVIHGDIVFESVTFSHDGQQGPLNGMSFKISKGKTVALVGPSGGGKSTILRLLSRFYDTSSGHVYLDGQDISTVTQASLRKNIGIISKNTVIFNESIYYNINYGNIYATREDIIRAAKEAQLHQKIESFPNGYETKIGEHGFQLSSVEKLRLEIARTILKNPRIILLDDVTESLDSVNQRDIQQALSSLTRNRTTIFISHKLTNTANADTVLVVNEGKVVEAGTHRELIERALIHGQSLYFEMWQKQLHEDTSDTIIEVPHSSGSNNNLAPSADLDPKRAPRHGHGHHRSRSVQSLVESQIFEVEEQETHEDESHEIPTESIVLDADKEEDKKKSP